MKKKIIGGFAAVALALGITLATAPAANAEWLNGHSNCTTTWSYTWANSTASLKHLHETGGQKRYVTKPSGVSSYKGWLRPGNVYFELDTSGTFSGEVMGCAA